MANIVFIDNFDSFTYNLVDQFRSLGHSVKIYRNHIPAETIEQAINELEKPRRSAITGARCAIRSWFDARADSTNERQSANDWYLSWSPSDC